MATFVTSCISMTTAIDIGKQGNFNITIGYVSGEAITATSYKFKLAFIGATKTYYSTVPIVVSSITTGVTKSFEKRVRIHRLPTGDYCIGYGIVSGSALTAEQYFTDSGWSSADGFYILSSACVVNASGVYYNNLYGLLDSSGYTLQDSDGYYLKVVA